MTTHVFVVNETTFQYHLKYQFAGTGDKDKDVDFNDTSDSSLYPYKQHAAEAGLVGMMADCARVRIGDLVIFYLQATNVSEGKFYGVFQVVSEPFLDRAGDDQYLAAELDKNLTFRIRISPYQVFAKGVTEWKALDEIRRISSPCQMLWSLIYRKLKGNRGNTMITIYESERLVDLIRRENDNISLPFSQSYMYADAKISVSVDSYTYSGNAVPFNILPRLIKKHNDDKAYEAHLQMYILQNVGRNDSLDRALSISSNNIEWIGNEVSCGVGMQRIDVMLSKVESESQRILMPIELKAVYAQSDNLRQIRRYIDWIEQYYIPNRISTIRPVLICRAGGLTDGLKEEFRMFNNQAYGRYLPLLYIEYTIEGDNLIFTDTSY